MTVPKTCRSPGRYPKRVVVLLGALLITTSTPGVAAFVPSRHVAAVGAFVPSHRVIVPSRHAIVPPRTPTSLPPLSLSTKNEETPESPETPEAEKEPSISNLFEKFQAFQQMAWPFFKENEAGRWLFAGMIALTIMNSSVSVAFSYVGRDFWSALSSKDTVQFQNMLVKYSAALVVGAPVSVMYRFQRERLAVAWREWMTDRTLQLYYSNRVYYSLERNAENEIDNPDQRIAEDVKSFTAFSLTLFLTLITSLIDLVSFSLILYSIQPQLFGAIIGYAAFGTVTTTSLGKRLVGLNFERLQTEADFRYSLVRIRENAESIAFYKGEDIEGREISKRFGKVVENKKELIGATRNLEFFTTAYQYLIQVLPVSVVAPQYFAGSIELGVISQSSGAFNHILSDLSIIVNQFEQLSSFSAGIDRLYQFMQAIQQSDPDRTDSVNDIMAFANATKSIDSDTSTTPHGDPLILPATPESLIELNQMDPAFNSTNGDSPSSLLLSTHGLTLTTPDRKRVLIKDLDISLQTGENLLIVGNSGAGKSSFLRALAGLWTAGSGSISRVSDEDVYFLPQRPYCVLGSLKDQLLYPSAGSEEDPQDYPEGHQFENNMAHILNMSDDDLLDILRVVNLSELPLRAGDGDPYRGLNVVTDWSNTLSLGEQQRLAFGRVLVNKPLLVILDEATSALDLESEAVMYKLLRESEKRQNVAAGNGDHDGVSGISFISVGHRPSLLKYHDKLLRLNGEGDYTCDGIAADVTLESVQNI